MQKEDPELSGANSLLFFNRKLMGNGPDPSPGLPGANSFWQLIENNEELPGSDPGAPESKFMIVFNRKSIRNCPDLAPGLPGANAFWLLIQNDKKLPGGAPGSKFMIVF